MRLALTHRSFLHHGDAKGRESNERLEYLGDSVLGLVCSEWLYKNRPHEHEGQLTKTKSLLVSKAILSRRALAMGLGRFVLLSHSEVESGGRQRLSILADTFEAVIGAIYLDQGLDAARQFITTWLLNEAESILADRRHTNYKSLLQEYVQSHFRTHPVYRIRAETGPDHLKIFTVEVMVGSRLLGQGRGQNKKEAEQSAARDALDRVAARAGARRGERLERPERGERLERPERGERLGRPERPERGERLERPERSERLERPERGERLERPERPERGERLERPERGERRRRRRDGEERPTRRSAEVEEVETPGEFRESRDVEAAAEEPGPERRTRPPRPERRRGGRRGREERAPHPVDREREREERPSSAPPWLGGMPGESREPADADATPRIREGRSRPHREPQAPVSGTGPREASALALAAAGPAAEPSFGRSGKPATRGLHSAAARADLEAARPAHPMSPSVAETGVGTPVHREAPSLLREELLRPVEAPEVEIRRDADALPPGAPRDRYRAAESGGEE